LEESKTEEFRPTVKETGLSEKTIQIMAITILVVLVIADKILAHIQPPLPEYWYGLLFGVSVLGTQITQILKKFK